MLTRSESRFSELSEFCSTALLDYRYEPNTGVQQRTITTGDIALKQNNQVGFELVNWSGRVDETAATATAIGDALGSLITTLLAIDPEIDLAVSERMTVSTSSSFSEIRNRQLSELLNELTPVVVSIEKYV